ncbi:MAG: hypothetical protein WBA16_04260 [Nonlabens sp.]
MKLLYILCTFFLFNTDPSGFKFEIPEGAKLESTFSSKIADNTTIHQAIVKNKKQGTYDFLTFVKDPSGEIITYPTLQFEKEADVLSIHNGKNGTVVQTFYSDGKIEVVTYSNTEILSREAAEINEKPRSIFQGDEKTVIAYYNSRKGKHQIENYTISGDGSITFKETKINRIDQKKYKTMFNEGIDIVNLKEYVKNGSINDVQGYMINDDVLIVEDKKADDRIYLLRFDSNGELKKEMVGVKSLENARNSNTFVTDDRIFNVSASKEDVLMQVLDRNSKRSLKTISLNKEIREVARDVGNIDQLLKGARKKVNAPTVSVNATGGGDVEVTLDYVNRNTYRYQHWDWFQQHMMMQQMMMMNRMNGFGPSASFNEGFYIAGKGAPVKFVLTADFTLKQASRDLKTIFPNIDKQTEVELMDKDKNVKELSVVFVDSTMHYIHADKSKQTVYIKSKQID